MYRHTGDRRYFDENLKLVRVVINNRDDRRVPQEQLWNGSVVPLWSDGTYSSRGREAYVLHTGLIAYPIFDFLLLAREDPDLLAAFDPGEYDRILADVQAAVAFHDAEWVDGPRSIRGLLPPPARLPRLQLRHRARAVQLAQRHGPCSVDFPPADRQP